MVSRFVYGARPHVPDLILRGGAVYRIVSDGFSRPRVSDDNAFSESAPGIVGIESAQSRDNGRTRPRRTARFRQRRRFTRWRT
jgi:hypothetical protein